MVEKKTSIEVWESVKLPIPSLFLHRDTWISHHCPPCSKRTLLCVCLAVDAHVRYYLGCNYKVARISNTRRYVDYKSSGRWIKFLRSGEQRPSSGAAQHAYGPAWQAAHEQLARCSVAAWWSEQARHALQQASFYKKASWACLLFFFLPFTFVIYISCYRAFSSN